MTTPEAVIWRLRRLERIFSAFHLPELLAKERPEKRKIGQKGEAKFTLFKYSGFACIGTPKFDLFLAIVEGEFH